MPDSVSIRYISLDILRDCHLTEPGYKRLVGSTGNSWGWCLKTMKVYHDSRKYRHGVPYPRDIDDKLRMPDTFYMILDMDRGTLAFQVTTFSGVLIFTLTFPPGMQRLPWSCLLRVERRGALPYCQCGVGPL